MLPIKNFQHSSFIPEKQNTACILNIISFSPLLAKWFPARTKQVAGPYPCWNSSNAIKCETPPLYCKL